MGETSPAGEVTAGKQDKPEFKSTARVFCEAVLREKGPGQSASSADHRAERTIAAVKAGWVGINRKSSRHISPLLACLLVDV